MQSRRMAAVQTPIIPTIGELIRLHPGTISLGQGVVYYGPPPGALDAIQSRMSEGDSHKYKPVLGIPELREAIGKKLAAENGIAAGADLCAAVSAGANMAFINAVLAIADGGDEIILLKPYYFNHEMAVAMAGCRPVAVDTDEHYQPDLARIQDAINARTRAVVTVSPNNPSGAVYPESTLRAINALCAERGIFHIHDEAYEYFVYDGARHFSPGSIDDSRPHTISLFSLSKSYGFASWRIGYMAFPSQLRSAVEKIQDTILICPPVVSQYAALGALEAGSAYPRGKLGEIVASRKVALAELGRLEGICEIPAAQGAFYILLRVNTKRPALELAEQLIRDCLVAVIPGETFGMDQGCFLRVAYGALRSESAAEGIGRLARGLREIVGGEAGA